MEETIKHLRVELAKKTMELGFWQQRASAFELRLIEIEDEKEAKAKTASEMANARPEE